MRDPEEKFFSYFQTVRSTCLVFKMFECQREDGWCSDKFDSQEERDFHQAHTCCVGSKFRCKIKNCDCVKVLQKMDIGREKKTVKFLCDCLCNHESMKERDFHEAHDCVFTAYSNGSCQLFLDTRNCNCLEELSREGCDPVIFERLEQSLRAVKVWREK